MFLLRSVWIKAGRRVLTSTPQFQFKPSVIASVKTKVGFSLSHTAPTTNRPNVSVQDFDSCQSYLIYRFEKDFADTTPGKEDWEHILSEIVGTISPYPVKRHNARRFLLPAIADTFILEQCKFIGSKEKRLFIH